jgi:hypothetical protein
MALLVALGGILLGIFVASRPGERVSGVFFALWWVPGAVAAVGVLVRDGVIFTVGAICFAVAGAAFLTERKSARRSLGGEPREPARGPARRSGRARRSRREAS